VAALQAAHPQIPVILFPRGAGESYAGYARIPGLSGLSLDSGVDLGWAAKTLQAQVALQGNLDPDLLVAGGAAMRRAIHRILEGLGQGALIFNLGHGILPQTPPEHVAELVELVRGWRG